MGYEQLAPVDLHILQQRVVLSTLAVCMLSYKQETRLREEEDGCENTGEPFRDTLGHSHTFVLIVFSY